MAPSEAHEPSAARFAQPLQQEWDGARCGCDTPPALATEQHAPEQRQHNRQQRQMQRNHVRGDSSSMTAGDTQRHTQRSNSCSHASNSHAHNVNNGSMANGLNGRGAAAAAGKLSPGPGSENSQIGALNHAALHGVVHACPPSRQPQYSRSPSHASLPHPASVEHELASAGQAEQHQSTEPPHPPHMSNIYPYPQLLLLPGALAPGRLWPSVKPTSPSPPPTKGSPSDPPSCSSPPPHPSHQTAIVLPPSLPACIPVPIMFQPAELTAHGPSAVPPQHLPLHPSLPGGQDGYCRTVLVNGVTVHLRTTNEPDQTPPPPSSASNTRGSYPTLAAMAYGINGKGAGCPPGSPFPSASTHGGRPVGVNTMGTGLTGGVQHGTVPQAWPQQKAGPLKAAHGHATQAHAIHVTHATHAHAQLYAGHALPGAALVAGFPAPPPPPPPAPPARQRQGAGTASVANQAMHAASAHAPSQRQQQQQQQQQVLFHASTHASAHAHAHAAQTVVRGHMGGMGVMGDTSTPAAATWRLAAPPPPPPPPPPPAQAGPVTAASPPPPPPPPRRNAPPSSVGSVSLGPLATACSGTKPGPMATACSGTKPGPMATACSGTKPGPMATACSGTKPGGQAPSYGDRDRDSMVSRPCATAPAAGEGCAFGPGGRSPTVQPAGCGRGAATPTAVSPFAQAAGGGAVGCGGGGSAPSRGEIAAWKRSQRGFSTTGDRLRGSGGAKSLGTSSPSEGGSGGGGGALPATSAASSCGERVRPSGGRTPARQARKSNGGAAAPGDSASVAAVAAAAAAAAMAALTAASAGVSAGVAEPSGDRSWGSPVASLPDDLPGMAGLSREEGGAPMAAASLAAGGAASDADGGEACAGGDVAGAGADQGQGASMHSEEGYEAEDETRWRPSHLEDLWGRPVPSPLSGRGEAMGWGPPAERRRSLGSGAASSRPHGDVRSGTAPKAGPHHAAGRAESDAAAAVVAAALPTLLGASDLACTRPSRSSLSSPGGGTTPTAEQNGSLAPGRASSELRALPLGEPCMQRIGQVLQDSCGVAARGDRMSGFDDKSSRLGLGLGEARGEGAGGDRGDGGECAPVTAQRQGSFVFSKVLGRAI